jgi:hypothetical protein
VGKNPGSFDLWPTFSLPDVVSFSIGRWQDAIDQNLLRPVITRDTHNREREKTSGLSYKVNNRSHGQNLSSTTGTVEPLAQYFLKISTTGKLFTVHFISWHIPIPSSSIAENPASPVAALAADSTAATAAAPREASTTPVAAATPATEPIPGCLSSGLIIIFFFLKGSLLQLNP